MSSLLSGRVRTVMLSMLWGLGTAAHADEAIGKVSWIDERNLSLLLECQADGCQKIPNAKPGETYTFIFPASLRAAILALREGDLVKIAYDDAKEKGYVITAVVK